MKTPLIWAISSACAAAALSVALVGCGSNTKTETKTSTSTSITTTASKAAPTTSQAKSYVFKFGDEDAYCRTGQTGGKADVVCDVANPTWKNAPPRPPTCQAVWGDRIKIVEDGKPALECHSDTLTTINPQYASGTQISGSITCIDNGPWSGTKCTDTRTGNFFNIAVDSYQLSPPA